jgi:DNA-binding LacI/PurR family transcriptional regulator
MERRRGRPTSYDVARRAGVSQATVSRAFNPESPASDDVRKRVLAAAAEIGYAPNAMARSLNSGRSKIIGVLMHVVHIEGFPTVLVRLNHAIQTSGRQMLLFTIDAEEEADQALAHMLEYQVDGIISSATVSEDFSSRCAEKGIAIVTYNRFTPDPLVSCVDADHVTGAALAAELLYEAGHRKFALIGGPRANPVARLRREGFIARLAGRASVAEATGDFTYESGHSAALHLMANRERPDAIFCANDIMALGCMDALRFTLGLRVPADISVVGFDDTRGARRATYDVTSLSQPDQAMADEAVMLLDALLKGEAAVKVTAPLKLRVRGSAILPARFGRGDYELERIAPDVLGPDHLARSEHSIETTS